MTDPFAEYAHKATSTARARLVGPIATRAIARQRYAEIMDDIGQCHTPAELSACLVRHETSIIQFKAELEFLWLGDGMFLGLEKEIAWATARVDERLDFPRWEPAEQEEGTEA